MPWMNMTMTVLTRQVKEVGILMELVEDGPRSVLDLRSS